MSDHNTPGPDDRDKWQLSDWTVALALFTILFLGGLVSYTTATPDRTSWSLVDQSAVQVKAAGD